MKVVESHFEKQIRQRIEENIAVDRLLLEQAPLIAQLAHLMVDAYRNSKKALFFGNGGSAADAQHLAAEFVGRFCMERVPLPALALNVNTSALTAIGNDYSYGETFSRQLEALGCPGDIAVGISTSGNSENVLAAFQAAQQKGLITVGLTGPGGKIKDVADYCICIPSSYTPHIQECHIMVGHILCELIEMTLFSC